MNKSRFKYLMYIINQALCVKISEFYKVNYKEAREMLYNSKLYNALEDEKTKMWHFSSSYLFDMFKNEIETGELNIYEG